MKLLFAMMALTMPVMASAQTMGPVLIQDIRAGMSAQQVQTVHPEARMKSDGFTLPGFRPIDGCPATVSGTMRNGAVVGMEMGSDPWKPSRLGKDCGQEAMSALVAKYGPPASEGWSQSGERLYGWTAQGVSINLRKSVVGSTGVWHATYAVPDLSAF
jgi:hypothetical protein